MFPKTMAEYGALLENDAIVVVRGRLDLREDEPKIVCMEVRARSSSRGTKDLRITLPLGVLTDAKVDGLKEVLAATRAHSPVLLHVGPRSSGCPPSSTWTAATGSSGSSSASSVRLPSCPKEGGGPVMIGR